MAIISFLSAEAHGGDSDSDKQGCGKGLEWLRAHKCWLLHRAHPGATSATLCCPVPGGDRGEGGRLRPSRDGAPGVLPGKGGSRRGAEGLWQGLDLMAGTHRVLRLGTEPQQHPEEPRGNSAAPGARRVPGEGAAGTGGGRAIPAAPAGTGDPAGTYSSRSSQQGMGRREGRARGERGDTVTAQGELLALRDTSKRGQCKPALLRATQHQGHPTPGPPNTRAIKHQGHQTPGPPNTRNTKHSPQAATPPGCFMLEQPHRGDCVFSPVLHVKLQIVFFIHFLRLL